MPSLNLDTFDVGDDIRITYRDTRTGTPPGGEEKTGTFEVDHRYQHGSLRLNRGDRSFDLRRGTLYLRSQKTYQLDAEVGPVESIEPAETDE